MLKTNRTSTGMPVKATMAGLGLLAVSLAGPAGAADVHGDLTKGDMKRASQALETAMESTEPGKSVTWKNPKTGNSGAITPGRAFAVDGRPCRDFSELVTSDGTSERYSNYACRVGNGAWALPEG